MKKGPFKMKGMDFGVSPVKQESKKTFDRIQNMKNEAKKFVKSLKPNIKKVVTTAGKTNLLSLLLSSKNVSANTNTPPPPLNEYKPGRGKKIK